MVLVLEAAPPTGRTLDPDAATVGLDKALDDGESESHTGTVGFSRLPEPVEHKNHGPHQPAMDEEGHRLLRVSAEGISSGEDGEAVAQVRGAP